MNLCKTLAAAVVVAALSSAPARANDVRVNCVTDERVVCRNDDAACWPPVKEPNTAQAQYRFTFDLTNKTGSLVYCMPDKCLAPSALNIIPDQCAPRVSLADCVPISVWEPLTWNTWTISNSRFVMTFGDINDHWGFAAAEFGRCFVQ